MRPLLLVEDTADDVFFLQRSLKKAAIDLPLIIAEDGQKALDYILGQDIYADRTLYPPPFLILLDLKLPKVTGLEVLEEIRRKKALQDVPVIVLTSSSEEKDIQAAYALGANSYKVKPTSSEELTVFLKALTAYWLHHDQACRLNRAAR